MIGFFKRFLRKASGEALLSRMEQPSSVDDTYERSETYLIAYAAKRRLEDRHGQIKRLRRNKKRFSHLLAENEADICLLRGLGIHVSIWEINEKA